MNRFENILVVYDAEIGAEDALTQASSLAAANGARLTLVDVCPVGQRAPSLIAERERRLQRTARSLQLEGVENSSALVFADDGVEEVVSQVVRGGHDMVVAGSEGGGALQRVLYGDRATALMRRCPCPVWIVKPGQRDACQRVLAAVEVDPDSADPDLVSARIVEMASSFAARHGTELHILHAWDVTGNDANTIYSDPHDATRERLLASHRDARRTALDMLLERHVAGQVTPLVHLPRAEPVAAICDAVEAREIDLVIMGTASRSGLSALLIGNSAESILSAARCGVMTVKTEDIGTLITPVRERDVA